MDFLSSSLIAKRHPSQSHVSNERKEDRDRCIVNDSRYIQVVFYLISKKYFFVKNYTEFTVTKKRLHFFLLIFEKYESLSNPTYVLLDFK